MQLKDKKILVTGGAGFLGSYLCERLIREGGMVRILDSFDSGKKINIVSIVNDVELIHGDIADEKLVKQGSLGVDIIINLAFPLGIRIQAFSWDQIQQATGGFFNVLGAAFSTGALLVQISSIAVYGNQKYVPIKEDHPLEPETVYGAIKLTEEIFCSTMKKTQDLRMVVLRIADIFGPRNTRLSVPVRFLLNALSGQPILVHGDGSQARTYTYVTDFVEGVLSAMASTRAEGEFFNIAGSECTSILELAQMAREITASTVAINIDPEKWVDSRRLEIDISKARQLLKFEPRGNIRSGLAQTYDWLRKNPNVVRP